MFFTTSRPIIHHRTVNRDFLKLFSKVCYESLKAFFALNRDVFWKANLHEYLLLLRWVHHLWWQITNFYETLIYSVWLKNWHILNNLLIVMPELKQQWLYSCWWNIAFTLNSINISNPLKMTGIKAILMIFNKSKTHFTRRITTMNKWHLYEVYSDPKKYQDS